MHVAGKNGNTAVNLLLLPITNNDSNEMEYGTTTKLLY